MLLKENKNILEHLPNVEPIAHRSKVYIFEEITDKDDDIIIYMSY